MGDTKRFRKKFIPPRHPWNAVAIEEERKIVNEYGLHNKQEIFVANSFLKKYKDIAKKLIADTTPQGIKEKEQMMNKLLKLGLIRTGGKLDDVLGLTIKDIMERRVQSQVCRKNLARSMKQARQFITHGHIMIGSKALTSPSYVLSLHEENQITFNPYSSLASEVHPERTPLAPKKVKERPPVDDKFKKRNFNDKRRKKTPFKGTSFKGKGEKKKA